MATHSSVLAWRIPGTEEPGGLQSMGCKESDSTEQLTLLSPSPSLLFLPHNRSINPREVWRQGTRLYLVAYGDVRLLSQSKHLIMV